MDIARSNLIAIAKLTIRQVVQVSQECQQLVIDGGLNSDSPPRNTLSETQEALYDRLLDIIEHCLCHGLRKDPFITETVLTSDSYVNKDNSSSPKSVLRRAKEQVFSKANNLFNAPFNLPNPWPVILHMEQMLPNVERISTNINTISEVRTGLGKCRVWIRQALMCKQLSTFFLHMAELSKGSASLPSVQLPNGASSDVNSLTYVTCPGHLGFYHPESFMLSKECVIFCGLLSALSCVDFCFTIKDNLKDLDSGLRLLPYYLYLQPSIEVNDQSVNKPVDSLAVDMKVIMGERKYLKDVNAKLLQRLDELLASKHDIQESLRLALASVEQLKVENRSLRIIMDHLKRSRQAEQQRAVNNGRLSVVANSQDTSDGTSTTTTTSDQSAEKVVEVGELREHIKKLSLELEVQTNLVSAMRNELSTRRGDHEQLLNLYSKLQSVDDQKDMVIRHLEDKNTGLSNIIDQMKERLDKSEIQRSKCERDASRLRLEVASLGEQSSQQQTDIHVQRQMIRSMEGKLEERAEQLAEFQQCRETLADYKQRNRQLSEALEKWRSRCEAQESSLSDMAAVVSSSKLEADSLRECNSALVEARWVDDADAEVCCRCEARFSVTLRRHHCRNCGLVFCYACSSNTMQLPSSAKPLRVCDACHAVLMQRYSTTS